MMIRTIKAFIIVRIALMTPMIRNANKKDNVTPK